jgi:hypothetical protein
MEAKITKYRPRRRTLGLDIFVRGIELAFIDIRVFVREPDSLEKIRSRR